jgi:hypothetical protein
MVGTANREEDEKMAENITEMTAEQEAEAARDG